MNLRTVYIIELMRGDEQFHERTRCLARACGATEESIWRTMTVEIALEIVWFVADASVCSEVKQEAPRATCWVYRQTLISPEPGSLAGSTAKNGAVIEKLSAAAAGTMTPESGSKSAAT